MAIQVVELTGENILEAPEWAGHPSSCKYCLYWEDPQETTASAPSRREESLQRKRAWFDYTRRDWGPCGKLLYVDGQAIGYAQYAPPKHLPGAAGYPAGPPSEDAVLVSCLFIPDREFRGLGLGYELLRTILGELRGRRVNAIETYARRGSAENPSGPFEFYVRQGFRVFKDDQEFPLVRLDLAD